MFATSIHPTRPLAHRLYNRVMGIRPRVLNDTSARGGTAPADLLHTMADAISAVKAVAFAAGRVDYGTLRGSAAYADYRAAAGWLAEADLSVLQSDAERTAFWINLYNMLAIDVVLTSGAASIQDAGDAFFGPGYVVGGHFYTLHDIEQGLLRANAGYPGLPGPQFRADDPRLGQARTTVDARIHFALVCAAMSCPPIRLYEAARLDNQLDLATQSFVNSGEVTINTEAQTATLSKIFQWYAPDFGAGFAVTAGFGDARPILRWVAPYLTDASTREAVLASSDAYRVTFRKYDWALNAASVPVAVGV
ncbi:MAG: DUF547 domain-containing protein [Chloroflexota bacterium]